MRVEVQLSVCRGYANCVVESPDVFDIDDNSAKVVVLNENPADDIAAETRAAAASCPVRAITIVE